MFYLLEGEFLGSAIEYRCERPFHARSGILARLGFVWKHKTHNYYVAPVAPITYSLVVVITT